METGSNPYFTLITGASSGIGKALAFECAKRGMNLFLISLPETGLPDMAKKISDEYYVEIKYFEINLTDENAHNAIHNQLLSNNITINILINNVGVGYNGYFEKLTEDKISDMLMLNIRMTTLLTQIMVPELKKLPKAYILNISSFAAFSPLPGKSIYAASKAYVLYFTRAIRQELKSTNISVSGLFPAGVPTNSLVQERIRKSGWLSKSMVLSPEKTARTAISGLLKGKEIIIPGNRTKAIFLLGSWMPQGLVLKMITREFLRAPN